jgi:hypothetical protein
MKVYPLNAGTRVSVISIRQSYRFPSRPHSFPHIAACECNHSQVLELGNVSLCDSLRAPPSLCRSGSGSEAVLRSDPTPTWRCCMPMAKQHAPAAVRLHDPSPWLTLTLLFCPRHCCSVCVHGDDSEGCRCTSQHTGCSSPRRPSTGIAAAVSMSPSQWCVGITRRCNKR